MAGLKVTQEIAAAVEAEAVSRRADVEAAVILTEEETIKLQDQIDVIKQRLSKLEEGRPPAK